MEHNLIVLTARSRLIHTLDEQGLPPPGLEYRLAHHFLARPNAPTTRILYHLLARPRRFGELRELLGLKHDNSVTVGLKTLRQEDVIEQRLDVGKEPPVYTYELNATGIQVVMLMKHFALLEAAERAAFPGARRGRGAHA